MHSTVNIMPFMEPWIGSSHLEVRWSECKGWSPELIYIHHHDAPGTTPYWLNKSLNTHHRAHPRAQKESQGPTNQGLAGRTRLYRSACCLSSTPTPKQISNRSNCCLWRKATIPQTINQSSIEPRRYRADKFVYKMTCIGDYKVTKLKSL